MSREDGNPAHALVPAGGDEDGRWMRRAIEAAAPMVGRTAPNPWVGAALVGPDGAERAIGATEPQHGRHAEALAIAAAGYGSSRPAPSGTTLYVTLEPCDHFGANPPCTAAIIDAGVARVVVGTTDPDPHVAGAGIAALRAAGLEVVVGVEQEAVEQQLQAYLHQRRTGRPFTILKLATTLDGYLAAPDRTSKWVTGPEARRDVHLLRSRVDAIVVGAGTVRADDPELTVRLEDQPGAPQPERIVLGTVPESARVLPAREWHEPLEALLDQLGREGALTVLLEGGGTVAGAAHRAGLIDQYWFYLAPALMGGHDGVAALTGSGAPTMLDAWRGRFVDVQRFGADVRIIMEKG